MTQRRAKLGGHFAGPELQRGNTESWRTGQQLSYSLFLRLCLLSLGLTSAAYGQALPAATADPISTGFHLPTTAGQLSYSLSASENFTSGFFTSTGWQSSTSLSGNLAMITASRSYPFSMIVSSGRSWSTSAEPSTNYADIAVSQVINTHRWGVVLTDSLAYLPATPSVGLSGIPGTGDVGLTPVPVTLDNGVGVLTSYSTQLNNSATASVQRRLTPRISASVSAGYTMLRFVGSSAGAGIDSDGYNGTASVSDTLNARSSISANYSYANNSASGSLGGFKSQTASGGYTRQINRKLNFGVYIGPQWSSVDQRTAAIYAGSITPGTSTNLYLSANLSYSSRVTNYNLGYSRGTNSGFGVTVGGHSDSVHFSASRTIDRVWAFSGNASYTRTTGINATNGSFAPKTFVAAAQVSRALARSISAFSSYTLEKQSNAGNTFGVFDLFTGSFQTFSVGLTYAPQGFHFGPR